jgi:hypothetical protein
VRQLNNDDDDEDLDFVQSPKKQLIMRSEAPTALKDLIANQPSVKFSDIHPRNKAGLTNESSDLEITTGTWFEIQRTQDTFVHFNSVEAAEQKNYIHH